MALKSSLSDISELNALVNSAYRGESSKKGWTTEADLLDGIRVDEERLKEMLQKSDSVILKKVNQQNKIIACVHLEKQEDKLYLGMLTVTPELQGKGIGKEFLKIAEDEARKQNCFSIYMSVITDRTELIAWYVKHGYVNTGIREPFPKNDVRFGLPKKELEFVLLEKAIHPSA